ncbi:MAG: adenylate/guanylate cyclase domain-containing protein [Xanthomonadales bacterium]|nr:adenylate/guanylate cyclase domain-containing protein [Xanthomonadales bacterium]
MQSEIRYARNNEGQSVAYQVSGQGPLDIVFIPDWVTNLEVLREEPTLDRFLNRLASFGRLILFDKRGSGLSDPVPLGAIPTPEEWMDDVRTVLNDIDSKRAAVLGHGEGGPMALLFAATHPERIHSLVLADTFARRMRAPDYPCGIPEHVALQYIDYIVKTWGAGRVATIAQPEEARNPQFIERRARLERLSMSPGQFAILYPSTYELDVRSVLETIRVPTLVLHREDNPYIRAGNGRYLAEHIDGARLVLLPGGEHLYHAGGGEGMLAEIQEFLTGTRETPDHDRILSTVLFTDIVGATERAAGLGDKGWRELLAQHHHMVRLELSRFRGKEIDTAGDGFFATFDGPARGVRCALAIRDVLRPLGLEVRCGLHTGECELMGDKVGGIAVHIAARVMSRADAGAVLVSRTVKDLVAGSGLVFEDQGEHALKGIEGAWQLFSAS